MKILTIFIGIRRYRPLSYPLFVSRLKTSRDVTLFFIKDVFI